MTAGVQRELLDSVKARKLAYYCHTMRKQGSCLEKEIMQGTMPGARRRGRPRMAWMDSIKTWTGLTMEESTRMTEDRENGESTSMVWPTLGSRTAKEQNRMTAGGRPAAERGASARSYLTGHKVSPPRSRQIDELARKSCAQTPAA